MNVRKDHRMFNRSFGLPGKEFGPGPWENEPGRVEWRHTGMPCLLRRNRMGVWCGYVAVSPDHPLHGKDYTEVDVSVHGGLTFASECDGDEGEGVCHVPLFGEPENVWWFGFDCGHGWDICPAFPDISGSDETPWPSSTTSTWAPRPPTYRDFDYAKSQTEYLAEQLKEIE